MPFLNSKRITSSFSTSCLRKQLITVLICAGFITTYGQFNLKIGYTLDYLNHEPLNNIFEDYNKSNPWLEKELSDVHFSNGIQLGFRLKSNFVAIDAHWERIKNSKTISGIDPESNSINKDLEFTFNRFAIGLEGYSKYVGLGVNVNYLRFNTNEEISGNKLNILRENTFGNKIYLIILAEGSDRMAMSLQPYIQMPWNVIKLSPLNSYLQSNNGNPIAFRRNYHFGISLIFYNGPQNN